MDPQLKIEAEIDQALNHPPCTFQGFTKDQFYRMVEQTFPMERIRTHCIISIIDGGPDIIIKWDKRRFILTDFELAHRYGSHPALKK